ncbi:MAG: YdcF family protein [Flavobacteriales bacterium]|jgi:uncharacterized SAM-binding protein YcdF (DUF218 family)|nr:YdcF family protein [Flavobacteriales bacterium]
MFFIISKIFTFLSQPIIWIFILLIIALLYKSKRRKILIISISLFYFFTNEFLTDQAARAWEASPKSISSLTHNYKYGIVLGGYSFYNKAIQHIDFNNNGDRLISAIELYKLGKIDKIIISGGNGKLINNGMKESEWSKSFLINMGIETKDILLENSSRNTMENAQNTAILIKSDISQKLLLITSANHMKRAKFCFNKNNFNIDCYPTDCTNSEITLSIDYLFIPNIDALEKWQDLIHEWIGYIVYKIKF